MYKIVLFVCTFLLFFNFNSSISYSKNADLAGTWYSNDPKILRSKIENYIDKAKVPKINGQIYALIAPHAGTRFSGPVAGYTYKIVGELAPSTVIVIGFSHKKAYDGIAIFTGKETTTPLGAIKTDLKISKKLIAYNKNIFEHSIAFDSENSIEMQIPFIQTALKNPKIVLIAIGDQSLKNVELISNALFEVLKDKKNFIIIGSTDMSHYLKYDRANIIDNATISHIAKINPNALYELSRINDHRLMCGPGALISTMMVAEKLGATRSKTLSYLNSGDTAGNKGKVVGYLSTVFYQENELLNDVQKTKLLKIARRSITEYLSTGKKADISVSDDILKSDMGVFVTLKVKDQLRGCIGNLRASGPLYKSVSDMALNAAINDGRFRPVTAAEMKGIDIEISALSPMVKIESHQEIEIGKHGVMVVSKTGSGVYLPQVATETGWSKEEFMNSLCGQKAGIAKDAWKTGQCDIYIFTAYVFGEKNDG